MAKKIAESAIRSKLESKNLPRLDCLFCTRAIVPSIASKRLKTAINNIDATLKSRISITAPIIVPSAPVNVTIFGLRSNLIIIFVMKLNFSIANFLHCIYFYPISYIILRL